MAPNIDKVLELSKFFSNCMVPNLSFAVQMSSLMEDPPRRLENLRRVIEEETHYLLEKKGYIWNREKNQFDDLGGGEYDSTRTVVTEALLMFMADYSDLKKLQKSH